MNLVQMSFTYILPSLDFVYQFSAVANIFSPIFEWCNGVKHITNIKNIDHFFCVQQSMVTLVILWSLCSTYEKKAYQFGLQPELDWADIFDHKFTLWLCTVTGTALPNVNIPALPQ